MITPQASKNLSLLRRASKLPIKKVAEFAQLSVDEYDMLELGRTDVLMLTLERLADLYWIELSDLLESDDILNVCHITHALATIEELGLLDMQTLYSMTNFNKIVREAGKMDKLALSELRSRDHSESDVQGH